MIRNIPDDPIITNVKNNAQFRMNSTAEMFDILSRAIYEYSIPAIVREISCNAYDAHIEAGNTNPIQITMPTPLEPTFVVEDFGIGLNDEDVYNIYTVYGESTKKKSNDLTGYLGLGSKSPYAYTQTFSIRTRKDGIERHYNAYTEKGVPNITLLREKQTSECNGVKVSIPVKSEDFGKFMDAAMHVYSVFPVMPEIINAPNFTLTWPSLIEELDESNYSVQEKKPSNFALYTGNFYAVMGNVAYQFKIPEYEELKEYGMTKMESVYMISEFGGYSKQLFVRFPMGSVEFAASRETLFQDDQTREVVIKRFVEIVKAKYASVIAEIDTIESPMAALKAAMYKTYLEDHVSPHVGMSFKNFREVGFGIRMGLWDAMFYGYTANDRVGNTLLHSQKRRIFFTAQSLVRFEKIVCIETDCKTPRGLQTQVCKQGSSNKAVFGFRKSVSERKKRVFEKAFGLPVEWLKLSVLLDAQRVENETKKIEKKERSLREQNQISASYYQPTKYLASGNAGPYETFSPVEHFIDDPKEYCYVTRTHQAHDPIANGFEFQSFRNLNLWPLLLGYRKVIVMNSSNEAKIRRLGIEDAHTVMLRGKKEHLGMLVKSYVKYRMIDTRHAFGASMFNRMLNACDPIIAENYKLIEKWWKKNGDNSLQDYSIGSKYLREAIEEIDDIDADTRKHIENILEYKRKIAAKIRSFSKENPAVQYLCNSYNTDERKKDIESLIKDLNELAQYRAAQKTETEEFY